ncbi:MAG: hypothetical protein K8S00_05560, partial [Bacteroidales bacterium]|nr:hypothetical protein [Bacteroidales bacterium]
KLYYITRTTKLELLTSLGLIFNTREVTNKWWITDVLINKSTGNVVDCTLESVTLVSDDLYAARNATCLEAITEGSSVTPTYGYLDRKWIVRFDYPQIGVYEIHPRYKRYDRSNSDFITEII